MGITTLRFSRHPVALNPLSRLTGLLFVFGVLLSISFSIAARTVGNDSGESPAREKLEKVVLSRIAFYARHFPGMDFVVLDSAGDVQKNMHALHKILGEDPIPLDYAHPEEIRHSLLMLTYIRIEFLLKAEIGSATLFTPGKDALARRKRVCVVTLNPWLIAKNDAAATRHLLELPESEFDLIPRSHYLDHISHLYFAVDHEVFHCLDTRFNGPMPRSKKTYWEDYQMLRNEDGADAFAILMQMKTHRRVTAYMRTFRLIRGLTLLEKDPDHYTDPAIEAAMQVNLKKNRLADVRSCIRVATGIRNRVVKSYTDFLRFAVAAEQAMIKLGVSPDFRQYDKYKADPVLVNKLIARTRMAYQKLTGHPLPHSFQ